MIKLSQFRLAAVALALTAWLPLQANAGRTRMLEAWFALSEQTDESAWWVRKAAAGHYAEHLPRLREWVLELQGRRRPS